MEEPDDLEILCKHLADIRLRMANLKEQSDTIAASIREVMAGREEVQIGTSRVTCKPSKRFSPKLASTLLSSEVLDAISEKVVSDGLAKRLLPPATYDACRADYGVPRITFTEVKQ